MKSDTIIFNIKNNIPIEKKLVHPYFELYQE